MADELICPECGRQEAMQPTSAGPNHVRCPACGYLFVRHAGVPAPSVLSGSLVPLADLQGIRKPRSIVRENLWFFAVFIPAALLGMGVIYWIIGWMKAYGR